MQRALLCLTATLLLAACSISTNTNNDASSSATSSVSSADVVLEKLTNALVTDRLRLEVVREIGGRNPCEPSEPYFRLKVRRHGAQPYIDESAPSGEQVKAQETFDETDLGEGIVVIERTGEVSVMDVCLE